MAGETTIEKQELPPKPLGDMDLHSKLLQESQGGSPDLVVQNDQKQAQASDVLPQLSITGQDAPASKAAPDVAAKPADQDPARAGQDASLRAVLPWTDKNPDGVLRQHMSYGANKDAIVRLGEGPFHVAQRLLGGPSAASGDVQALTKALIQQYKEETKDFTLESLRNGHPMLTERNIGNVISKIDDAGCRQRITDHLKQGWSAQEAPVPVPFEAHHRDGETNPSHIEDPAQFLKDMTQAMVNVKADDYWRRGLCAAGFRLAINQLPNWRIDGGSIDVSINKDIRGWRSGVQMALDLAQTGLFDVVPLKELGYKNLKQGYIIGRWHYPDYVKDRPSWKGEDFGDIDVWTPRHKPADDSSSMYRDSFVLIPKGLKR